MLELLRLLQNEMQIEARLIEWGRWCHGGYGGGYVSPSWQLMRANVGGVVRTPLISDDEAEYIGRAVQLMCGVTPEVGTAIKLYYTRRETPNLSWLGKELGVDRKKAGELLRGGISWLQGYFVCEFARVA